jgi:hypothetical protein
MAPKIDRPNPSLEERIGLTGWRSGLESLPSNDHAGARFVRATIAFWAHCGAIRKPRFISERRKVGLRPVSGKANAASSTKRAENHARRSRKSTPPGVGHASLPGVSKAGHRSVLFRVGERREAVSPILIALTLLNRINLLYYL